MRSGPSGPRPDRPFRQGPPPERPFREDRPPDRVRPRTGPPDRFGPRREAWPRASPGGSGDRGLGGSPWSGQERPALAAPVELAEGEELVAGRRPVEEAFAARRPALRLLVVPQRRAALERIVLHATNLRIPIVEVEGGSLTALAGFDGHQGVALVVEPRRFASLDDILARAVERGEPAFVLVLDSLEDPHNVGSLLRSAEAAGVHGVLFPTHRQAPLSPSAVKASAGAVEHLLLAPVDDLPAALSDLHARGVRIAGADGAAPLTARQTDLRGPIAMVIGSEGQGLGPAVRRRCDVFMRIPMRGAVGSLNAAVAGSILLFEAAAQRDLPEAPVDAGAAAVTTPPSVDTEPQAEEAVASEPTTPPARPRRARPKKTTPLAATTVEGPEAEAEPRAETEALGEPGLDDADDLLPEAGAVPPDGPRPEPPEPEPPAPHPSS
jgi:23S rRNA (guanosine2251-2'-O)-methyltransferase